jgi:hypothetical protein
MNTQSRIASSRRFFLRELIAFNSLLAISLGGCSEPTENNLNNLEALPAPWYGVVKSTKLQSGFDTSAAWCIEFYTQLDIDAIVAEYGLSHCAPDSDELLSFVSLNPPSWWKVSGIEETYARWDQEREQYWSLWIDRDAGLLFLEIGAY